MSSTSNITGFCNLYLQKMSEIVLDKVKMPYGFYQKIETRARNNDYTEAMSFETYDPLWLLGRQWQFGRFQGNDCGSTVSTKIEVERQPIDHIIANDGFRRGFTTEKPLEFDVEKRPHAIDPYVRIESALHFLGMKSLPEDKKTVMEMLREKCPLDPFMPKEEKTVEQVKAAANTKMDKLYRFYGKNASTDINSIVLTPCRRHMPPSIRSTRIGSRKSISRIEKRLTTGMKRNWDMN